MSTDARFIHADGTDDRGDEPGAYRFDRFEEMRSARSVLDECADIPWEVELDMAQKQLRVGGRPVALTPIEYAIVVQLAADPGRVVSRERLLAASRPDADNASSRSVDVHVAHVRRKLREVGAGTRIATLQGRGYQWLGAGKRRETWASALGELAIDVERRRVTRDGRSVPLTSRELDVILLLASRRGAVVTRSELRSSTDAGGDPSGRVFDVHISRLRAKLGDIGRRRRLIRTVRGRGWMIVDQA